MPDLCAYRLPLVGDGRERCDEALAIIKSEVRSLTGVDPAGERGSTRGDRGQAVGWGVAAGAHPEERVWTVSWSAPDLTDADTSSTVTVKIGLDNGEAWVIVRVGLLADGFRMTRVHFGLEPPPVVLALADALPAHEDGQALLPEPSFASGEKGVAELAALIRDPDRVLPVVVISSASRTRSGSDEAKPLVDCSAVARTLLGIAHVVVIDSIAASFALTEILGKHLSVYDGAVRLYWPGTAAMREGRDHTVWLPQPLLDRGVTWLRRALVRRLMPVAVIRFSSAALEARIRAAVEQDRLEGLLRLQIGSSEAAGGRDWKRVLELYESEIERLREENADLAEQLGSSQENLRTMAALWFAGSPDEVGS